VSVGDIECDIFSSRPRADSWRSCCIGWRAHRHRKSGPGTTGEARHIKMGDLVKPTAVHRKPDVLSLVPSARTDARSTTRSKTSIAEKPPQKPRLWGCHSNSTSPPGDQSRAGGDVSRPTGSPFVPASAARTHSGIAHSGVSDRQQKRVRHTRRSAFRETMQRTGTCVSSPREPPWQRVDPHGSTRSRSGFTVGTRGLAGRRRGQDGPTSRRSNQTRERIDNPRALQFWRQRRISCARNLCEESFNRDSGSLGSAARDIEPCAIARRTTSPHPSVAAVQHQADTGRNRGQRLAT